MIYDTIARPFLGVSYALICVGTLLRCGHPRPHSIKPFPPPFLSWCHSREKRYQALSRFSVLQATESWAGPGNEATTTPQHLHNLQQPKSELFTVQCSCYLLHRMPFSNYVRMHTGSLVLRPHVTTFWLGTRLACMNTSMYDTSRYYVTLPAACMCLHAWTYQNNYSIVSTVSRYR